MASDPYFSSVKTLLHLDGTNGSATFTDSELSPRTFTGNASIALSTTWYKFGTASLYCSAATSQYLTAAASADFGYGTADFTIEFWIYVTAMESNQIMGLIDQRPLSTNGLYPTIYYDNLTGVDKLKYYCNSADRIVGTSMSLNAWHHIALSRASGSTKLFLDGTQVGSTYSDTDNISTASRFRIGSFSNSDTFAKAHTAYFDDLRVTKGTARYTTTFSVPAAAFPNYQYEIAGTITEALPPTNWIVRASRLDTGALIGDTAVDTTSSGAYVYGQSTYGGPMMVTAYPKIGTRWAANTVTAVNDYTFPTNCPTTPYFFKATTVGGDPYFSSVKLLLHCDGTDNSTTFTDSEITPKTMIPVGDVHVHTGEKKFGTASVAFDGNGDYLYTAATSDLVFGSGDFTIEMWVNPATAASGTYNIYDGRPLSTGGYYPYIGRNNDGTLIYYVNNSVRISSSSNAVPDNTWTHIAIARSGTTTNMFVGGVKQTPWTDTTTYASNANYGCRIGFNAFGANEYLNGYMDDIRITKGVARYTADFTPPAAAFPDTSPLTSSLDPYFTSNVLLMHCDGTDSSTTFTDVMGKTVTPNGNAHIHTGEKKFGSASCLLDGNSDYLSVTYGSSLSLISGDFTIECWIYPIALTAANMEIINKDGVSGTSYAQYDFAINSSGKLIAFLGNGNGVSPSGQSFGPSGTTVTTGAWHHVALVKTGSVCMGFLDGVQEWTTTITATMYEGSKALLIGYQTGVGATAYFNGYIDDIRITKGVARYTATFTPPTAAFPDVIGTEPTWNTTTSATTTDNQVTWTCMGPLIQPITHSPVIPV